MQDLGELIFKGVAKHFDISGDDDFLPTLEAGYHDTFVQRIVTFAIGSLALYGGIILIQPLDKMPSLSFTIFLIIIFLFSFYCFYCATKSHIQTLTILRKGELFEGTVVDIKRSYGKWLVILFIQISTPSGDKLIKYHTGSKINWIEKGTTLKI